MTLFVFFPASTRAGIIPANFFVNPYRLGLLIFFLPTPTGAAVL
jgi:hypothetical protein